MKRYFFGLTGSQDVQDAQDLTFKTDLAASEAAAGWRRGCRGKYPELRGTTSVVAACKDQGETYYVSL
jgi:hypothetical protein